MARRAKSPEANEIPASMKSPLDLGLVFKFAFLLGAVLAAGRILTALFGPSALLPVAAVAGVADADAVTLTAARLAAQGTDLSLAAYAVLIAAGVDSLSKMTIAVVVGGPRFGAWFGGGTLVAAAAAGAAMYGFR